MKEALTLWREGEAPEATAGPGYVPELRRISAARGMKALVTALEQRYQEVLSEDGE